MSRKWYHGDTEAEYAAHLHDPTQMQPAHVTASYMKPDGYRVGSVTGRGFACPICKSAWLPYYSDKHPKPPMCDGVFVWRDDCAEPREEQSYPPAKFKAWEADDAATH